MGRKTGAKAEAVSAEKVTSTPTASISTSSGNSNVYEDNAYYALVSKRVRKLRKKAKRAQAAQDKREANEVKLTPEQVLLADSAPHVANALKELETLQSEIAQQIKKDAKNSVGQFDRGLARALVNLLHFGAFFSESAEGGLEQREAFAAVSQEEQQGNVNFDAIYALAAQIALPPPSPTNVRAYSAASVKALTRFAMGSDEPVNVQLSSGAERVTFAALREQLNEIFRSPLFHAGGDGSNSPSPSPAPFDGETSAAEQERPQELEVEEDLPAANGFVFVEHEVDIPSNGVHTSAETSDVAPASDVAAVAAEVSSTRGDIVGDAQESTAAPGHGNSEQQQTNGQRARGRGGRGRRKERREGEAPEAKAAAPAVDVTMEVPPAEDDFQTQGRPQRPRVERGNARGRGASGGIARGRGGRGGERGGRAGGAAQAPKAGEEQSGDKEAARKRSRRGRGGRGGANGNGPASAPSTEA